jgi:hypothetical protein
MVLPQIDSLQVEGLSSFLCFCLLVIDQLVFRQELLSTRGFCVMYDSCVGNSCPGVGNSLRFD